VSSYAPGQPQQDSKVFERNPSAAEVPNRAPRKQHPWELGGKRSVGTWQSDLAGRAVALDKFGLGTFAQERVGKFRFIRQGHAQPKSMLGCKMKKTSFQSPSIPDIQVVFLTCLCRSLLDQ